MEMHTESFEIRVRRAGGDDAEALRDFNVAMALETEGKTLDGETVLRGVCQLLSGDQDGFYLAAVCGERLVGSLMVTEEWSDWRNARYWWIQSVYVLPAYRRRGVFRRLMEAVRQRARRQADVCGLRLYVDQDNRSAQEAYRRLGFQGSNYRLFELEG